MTIDLDALERMAKAATRGNWRNEREPDTGNVWFDDCPTGAHPVESDAAALGQAVACTFKVTDARYIAAANPTAVLALIAELREARALVAPLREMLADARKSHLAHVIEHLDDEAAGYLRVYHQDERAIYGVLRDLVKALAPTPEKP